MQLSTVVISPVISHTETPVPVVPFRSREDYIAYLAIRISRGDSITRPEKSVHPPTDLQKAEQKDISDARLLLQNAGIRMYNDPAPEWHYQKNERAQAANA